MHFKAQSNHFFPSYKSLGPEKGGDFPSPYPFFFFALPYLIVLYPLSRLAFEMLQDGRVKQTILSLDSSWTTMWKIVSDGYKHVH